MTHRDLLKRALEALELVDHRGQSDDELLLIGIVRTELQEELEKPEPKPVAWLWDNEQIKLWLDSPHLPAGVISSVQPVPVYLHGDVP